MSERRVLRDRAALYQKSNPLNTKCVSVRSKPRGKENYLSQDLKNNDNVDAEMVINSQKSESPCNYKQKRKAARQNSTTKVKVCPMKESNHLKKKKDFSLFIENKSAPVHNQTQNMSGKLFTKSNINKSSTKSNVCRKKTVLNSVINSFSEKDSCKPKTVSDSNKIPIYHQASKPNKILQCVDIYDITLDEDFASNKEQAKKRIKPTKSKQKENRSKKLCHSNSKILKSKKVKLPVVNSVAIKLASKNDEIFTLELGTIETDQLVTSQTVLLDETKCVNKVTVEENGMEDLFSLSFPNNANDATSDAFMNFDSNDSKNENKAYLSNLAEELEKSFSIPRMTSTPEGTNLKTVIQTQKNKVVNIIANISDIPTNKKDCLNTTVDTPVILDNVLPETDKDIGEITLFESPEKTKEQNNELLSQKKSICINLFSDILSTPSSEDSLQDTVLVPKKAYHSPDNFKKPLIRTKKPVVKTKQEIKMSKQDLLIEKMSHHFDEIENTELCIE